MPEIISRMAPPSSAGIMFGVGANAARLDADRKTQLNLRRMCLGYDDNHLHDKPEEMYIRLGGLLHVTFRYSGTYSAAA